MLVMKRVEVTIAAITISAITCPLKVLSKFPTIVMACTAL